MRQVVFINIHDDNIRITTAKAREIKYHNNIGDIGVQKIICYSLHINCALYSHGGKWLTISIISKKTIFHFKRIMHKKKKINAAIFPDDYIDSEFNDNIILKFWCLLEIKSRSIFISLLLCHWRKLFTSN